ncbi:N-acetyl-alpha-D-glucosaminyl L-malate synthase [subsurface metagenome]
MNILMFDAAYPPPILGGKEKQAHLLARELIRQGEKVQALSYLHNGNKSDLYEGILIRRVRKGVLSVPSFLLHLIWLRFFFNIFHIHTPSRIGLILAIIGYFLNYKVLFKFPGQTIFDNRSVTDSLLLRIGLKISKQLIVLEDRTKNKLKRIGIEDNKIFNTVNGVEISELKLYSHESNEILLLYVGRLVPIKGCDYLIESCSLLDSSKINWKLFLIGDGPLQSNLQLLARKLNISDRVFFKGYHTNTIDFMRNADILILPSRSEGMSNVLLEAVSVGLPIVATDVGAARKIVGDYASKFLCKPLDPVDVANKIEVLAKNYEIRNMYGEYLHERGKKLFSIEEVAGKYRIIYHQIS